METKPNDAKRYRQLLAQYRATKKSGASNFSCSTKGTASLPKADLQLRSPTGSGNNAWLAQGLGSRRFILVSGELLPSRERKQTQTHRLILQERSWTCHEEAAPFSYSLPGRPGHSGGSGDRLSPANKH